ncbi:MAG: DUF2142 domain-containing protein [Butyribacter sp.]
MSNKLVKSKKKNTVSKYNGIDKNKKSIIVCLAVSFVISLLLSGIYFNSNYIYKYQSIWYEASITDCKGYNIEGTVYNYDENASEHYIDFSVPEVPIKTLNIQLNAAPGDTIELEADMLKDGKSLGKIDSNIPGHEQYAKLYFENRKINSVRVYLKGTFDYNSANVQSFQVNEDMSWLSELKHRTFKVFLIMFIIFYILLKRKLNHSKGIGLYDGNSSKITGIVSQNKGIIISEILCYVITFFGVLGLFEIGMKKSNYRNMYVFISLCVWIIISTIYWYIKNNKIKFEKMFLIVGSMLSCMFIVLLPNRLNISYDDQIHYKNIVALSHYPDKSVSVAEDDYYLSCFVPQLKNSCDVKDKSYHNIINDSYSKRTSVGYNENITYKSVVYMPVAIAMMILRGIGLNLSLIILGAKLAGMLFYLYIVYRGMKHLKNGKMVVAAASTMPGAMFIIANFNYDYWLIGLTLYSTCYIVGEYQNPDKYIKIKDFVYIIASTLLGIAVKVVYIPLLGIIAFLPKKKFEKKKGIVAFRCFFCGIVICAIIGFAILIFGGGLGIGDTRGGEEINAMGQIKYILSNPLQYTKTLLTFIKDYWSIKKIPYYNTATAYLMKPAGYWGYVAAFMLLVMLYDRSDNNTVKWYLSASSILIGFITSCMVATALYVVYNPVGSLSIVGCQARYLFPIIVSGMLVVSRIYIPIKLQSSIIKRAEEIITILFIIVLNCCMLRTML